MADGRQLADFSLVDQPIFGLRLTRLRQEVKMHAIRWGVPRLAIVMGGAVFAIVITYCVLVFAIVVVQAIASFGQ